MVSEVAMSYFVIDSELSLEDHRQMAEYKENYFDPELIIPPEITYEWYLYNPDTLVAVRDTRTGHIAGHLNFLPFLNGMLYEFLSGKLDASVFSVSYLKQNTNIIRKYNSSDEYYLYLGSAAVAPKYLGTNLFRMMVNTYGEVLLRLAKREIYISVIVSNAITRQGIKLCEYFKMKPGIISPKLKNIYISTRITDFFGFLKKPVRAELLAAYKELNQNLDLNITTKSKVV
ncbi:MAG: hypothetical protein PHU36_08565 [Syntrophomonadaceae bacterium]|nr:hypothetical protein [Syntrophomonadaceae bacterium]